MFNRIDIKGHTEYYLPFLERFVTSQTLQHSMGVMKAMSVLSEIYSLDCTQAITTGLLHDVAKDIEPERLFALAEEAQVRFFHECERIPIYLHGPVGAYLIHKELKINDQLLLDSISAHTFYGNSLNFNSPFSWCLRFADVLSPTKEWKGMRRFKNVVYSGKMEEAALLLCS